LHTLKGNAGLVGLTGMQELSHAMEDAVKDLGWTDTAAAEDLLRDVDRLRGFLGALGGDAAETASGETALSGVRLGFNQLDRLVDLVGEMVIFRNRLTDALGGGLPALPQERREAVGSA